MLLHREDDTVTESRLHQELEQLRREIEALPLEEGDKERLAGLVEDIETHDAADLAPHHILDSLDQQISRFEAEHPTLTGVLNNLLVSLSNMGV